MEFIPMKSQIGGTPIIWLIDYLSDNGITIDEVCEDLKLTKEELTPSSGIVPTRIYLLIMEWAQSRFNDPLFGTHLAVNLKLSDLGLMGYLLSGVKNIKQAFEFLERYHRVFSPDYDFSFIYGELNSSCRYESASLTDINTQTDIDFSLGVILRLCQQIAGTNFLPLTCSFEYPEPHDCSAHIELFGPNLMFSQSENIIVFDNHILDVENSKFEPNLLPILLHQANQLLDELNSKSDIVQQVKWIITTSLGGRDISTQSIADELNMSVRQLHRKLTNRGTSFKKLKEDIILTVAKEALINSRESITELALNLNYSETSAFDRMFKVKTGMTPLKYRNKFSLF